MARFSCQQVDDTCENGGGNFRGHSSKQAMGCLEDMSSADIIDQTSEMNACDTLTPCATPDDSHCDKFAIEKLEGKMSVTSPTPDKSRPVTRSLSKSTGPVDAPSLCHNRQEFQFRVGTRKRQLNMSNIVYAEASSGKLVLRFCNSYHKENSTDTKF